jgi:Protein of unknown function (DUF3313).
MSRARTADLLFFGCVASAALITPAQTSAQTRDNAPVAMQSADQLTQDKAGSESWTYINPRAVFTKYRAVIVDPTVVYDGPDAQFEGIDQADRVKFAQIMTNQLRSEIGKSFPPPPKATASTLRVRVNLLGVQKTKGGVATATRVTPLGLGLSAAKSLLGKQGTFTGSVLYGVEAFDGRTGELLLAAVRRRTPDPLDIPATLSTTNTIKSVARDFAVAARERLENMTRAQSHR